MPKARAVIGSTSQAMRALKALEARVIRAELVKIPGGGRAGRGCAYGVEFSSTQTDNVLRILAADGIAVREIINERK